MKKNLTTLFLLLLAPFHVFSQGEKLSGNITISGAFALYPMAVKWAEEYRKLNPGVQIDISAGGAGKGMTDVLSGVAHIALVSRDVNDLEIEKGAFVIPVTMDAVIPTISEKNPLFDQLMKKGMKRDAFVNLWITERAKTWGQATGLKSNAPVHVYTRSDAAGAAETWAAYLGKKQEDLLGVGVFGDPGLATAVKKDPYGIGYNNIVYVFDLETKKQSNGVRVVPIDLNNNGTLDPDEDFYHTTGEFLAAVANGKYPSPPARQLYFVTKGKPENKLVQSFVSYVLTSGQQHVEPSGFIKLPQEEIREVINRIK